METSSIHATAFSSAKMLILTVFEQDSFTTPYTSMYAMLDRKQMSMEALMV